MTNIDHPLAIVVPAFRAHFLEAALKSICAQTDQRFNLYVFDDASPDPIVDIVHEFDSRRAITFHRFDKNLGGTSLVAHWQRCLERITEPWVWLFSDDDLMDSNSVASFFQELELSDGNHDLYRCNTRSIDAKGVLISENQPHPVLEKGSDFLLARLQDKRTSTMQELIFSRDAYIKSGGIPDFPLAWASDDAFITRMGAQKPIKTIIGPCVSWRQSGVSISTNLSPANANKKITACQMMVEWTLEFLKKHPLSERSLSIADLQTLTSAWFFRRVYNTQACISFKTILAINSFAVRVWNWPWHRGLITCFNLNRPFIKKRLLNRQASPVLANAAT